MQLQDDLSARRQAGDEMSQTVGGTEAVGGVAQVASDPRWIDVVLQVDALLVKDDLRTNGTYGDNWKNWHLVLLGAVPDYAVDPLRLTSRELVRR